MRAKIGAQKLNKKMESALDHLCEAWTDEELVVPFDEDTELVPIEDA